MPETIFNGSTTESATTDEVASNQQEEKQVEASPTDPYADLLKSVVTEDGRQKYATVSDAINSIPNAQGHISKLESELKELREALAKEREEAAKVVTPEPTQTSQDASIGEEQVVGLVDQVLSQREKQAKAIENRTAVASTLVEKFGSTEAAEKAYNQKALEMGIAVEMLNDIAATSPKAVLAYFEGASSSAPAITEGSVNTASMSFAPKEQPKGKNPLLTGNMSDMQAEWNRIAKTLQQ